MGLAAAVGVAIGLATSTVFEVVAAVGVTLSVIGAVTHDKILSDVGLGLGLVGGIGGLAASAGLIGADAVSGATLFGPEAAASTADAAASTGGDVVDSFSSTDALYEGAGFDAGNATLSAADTGTAAADTSAAAAASGDAAAFAPPPGEGTFVGASQDATTAGAATQGGAITAGPPTTAAATATPDPAVLSQSMPPNPALTAGANNTASILNAPAGAGGAGIIGSGGGTLAPDSSGLLGDITGFVQKNPLLAYGVLQAGGSLISGLTSTLTPAQVTALNAQAAANQAAANLTTQQTQNLAQPRSAATLAPVTGAPNNIITPPNAGIINGAPPVNVTGAPGT